VIGIIGLGRFSNVWSTQRQASHTKRLLKVIYKRAFTHSRAHSVAYHIIQVQ